MKRPKFFTEFRSGGPSRQTDGRLDASSFHRNHRPILDVLRSRLDGVGDVVEIGSGTGQHIVGFAGAMPGLTWWPSDPDRSHLLSIAGWRAVDSPPNLMAPFRLDVLDEDWGLAGEGRPPVTGLAAIVCINVVHIAPWPVAQSLMRGAGRHLGEGGWLFLYGPFKRDGQHTAPSNATFDLALQRQDADWGVRDIGDLATEAAAAGLRLVDTVAMPANNLTLVFRPG